MSYSRYKKNKEQTDNEDTPEDARRTADIKNKVTNR